MKSNFLNIVLGILVAGVIAGCGGSDGGGDTGAGTAGGAGTVAGKPIITLQGENPATVFLNNSYTDAGATAKDSEGITLAVTNDSATVVKSDTAGSYTVTYTATDGSNNSNTATRVVNVIDTTACTDLGDIEYDEDTTLDGCYKTRGIVVKTSTLLTIKEGSILIFDSGTELQVDGALSAKGTAGVAAYVDKDGTTTEAVAAKPVTFTGATKSAGFWRGIKFSDAVDGRNLLDNVIIEYAGAVNEGALETTKSTKITVKNSIIRHNTNYGFYFSEDTNLLEFTNVASKDNEKMAGSIAVKTLGKFDSTSDFTENGKDYLEVRGGYVEEDQTWKRLSVPILIDSAGDFITIKKGSLVTVKAGVKIVFDGEKVRVDGALSAEGTATNPVIFTGETKSAGSWMGIRFNDTVDDRNLLDNVIIEYAGAVRGHGTMNDYGALDVTDFTKLTVENSTIRHSQSAGIHLSGCSVNLTDINNTFTDNDGADIERPSCP